VEIVRRGRGCPFERMQKKGITAKGEEKKVPSAEALSGGGMFVGSSAQLRLWKKKVGFFFIPAKEKESGGPENRGNINFFA